jgi:hypothetical protein
MNSSELKNTESMFWVYIPTGELYLYQVYAPVPARHLGMRFYKLGYFDREDLDMSAYCEGDVVSCLPVHFDASMSTLPGDLTSDSSYDFNPCGMVLVAFSKIEDEEGLKFIENGAFM